MQNTFRVKLVPEVSKGTLGTFAGVFTPSILTILGIILFLRLGYVVGQAGLARALVIIGLANGISVLTSFSLAAIATNLKVKGGGDYYLISRTLGVEFGGAIGIVLFLAQSVSIAFYCMGFGEAVSSMLSYRVGVPSQIIAVLAVSFLFCFAWLGADWATRFQYLVMGIMAAGILSFFIGGIAKWDNTLLLQSLRSPAVRPDFWILFAIFFPAVTGFTQGVSMSGDLKDPGRSLPLGTFMAVALSIIIYFGSALVFAASLPSKTLIEDYGAMKRVAAVPFFIGAGVMTATLSSAMASFMGAPRILQSMGADRIFPVLVPFSKGYGPAGNPRRGVLLSMGIAFATIGLGKLNLIAPVVSMCFLISYGLLNYATFYEARASSPSFRPRFRWFDARLSLAGFLACLGAILAINVAAGAVAIAILFAIYQYLSRTAGPSRWADSRRSYHLQRAREHLLAAAEEPEHDRDWRPLLLAFLDDARRRARLLRFASWLEGGSGLTTAVRILEGHGVKMLKKRREAEAELRSDIAEVGVKAFPLIVTASNLDLGVNALVQSYGIGPLRANTILTNWLEELPSGTPGPRASRYGHYLRAAFRLGCNIVILKARGADWKTLEALPAEKRRIDIWWTDDATSRLMLLLGFLLTKNDEWEGVKIRVLAPGKGKEEGITLDDLYEKLLEARIEAEPLVIPSASADAVLKQSGDAALVFLPFRLKSDEIMNIFDGPLEKLLSNLSSVALTLAAEDIDLDAEPEEGIAGEIAVALDALANAEKRVNEAEKKASGAAELAEKRREEIREALASGASEKAIKQIRTALLEAKQKARDAARRAARALAKAEDAAREVESLGVKPDQIKRENLERK